VGDNSVGHRLILAAAATIAALLWGCATVSQEARGDIRESSCFGLQCAEVTTGNGNVYVTAEDVFQHGSELYIATNRKPTVPLYHWRLRTPCELAVGDERACVPGACPVIPGRVVEYSLVQRQRLAQLDGSAIDGVAPGPETEPGNPYGGWGSMGSVCVDVTDLNPPPSPEEVFRYFRTLPLPELATRQQPPGNALVGLPVIFFTDSPTTQRFTVDIRGFTVDIDATASTYAWDTGDGTVLTTAVPGAPYPDQTITHDYASGTYTASLTTTWSAIYSVDGGATVDVPGTTTTAGLPVTFAVLQARTVLTNPYD